MDLTVDYIVFVYLGVFAFVVLLVTFCLTWWCLKGNTKRSKVHVESIGMVEEMAKMFKCLIVERVGYRDTDDPTPVVWSCSCDLQIYN